MTSEMNAVGYGRYPDFEKVRIQPKPTDKYVYVTSSSKKVALQREDEALISLQRTRTCNCKSKNK